MNLNDRIGGISSLDSAATRRAISQAAQEADDMQLERQARSQYLAEQLDAAITQGDAWATCHFANRRFVRCKDGSYVEIRENLGHVLGDSLDMVEDLSFHDVAQYLLVRAGEGDKCAQGLLGRMSEAWVRGQE